MNFRWKIAQAAEIRWWRKYLKNKSLEDYLNWKRNYWHQLLKKIDLKIEDGEYILDAGSGPAGIFIILKNNSVDAVDPLYEKYESELSHFNREWYSNVNFFSGVFENFKIEKSYDKVFCINAINHVANLEKSFDKLVEATKPGGNLIVSIDAHKFSTLKSLFRIFPGDILHPHQYSLEEYCQMLISRNCKIENSILIKTGKIFNYWALIAKRN